MLLDGPAVHFSMEAMTQTVEQSTQVVEVTPEAATIVIDAIAAEPAPETLALWLEVRGVEQTRYLYDLYFAAFADASDADARYESNGVRVVVPEASIAKLTNARLEYSEDNGGGLVMVNPNAPSAAEIAPGVPENVLALGLETDLAVRAIAILEEQVNPSIASHGGRADLVAFDVDGGIAYLALSGGCQGCAMSRATLSQGIEVALKEGMPEIVEVVDVTDHATGANPYYEG